MTKDIIDEIIDNDYKTKVDILNEMVSINSNIEKILTKIDDEITRNQLRFHQIFNLMKEELDEVKKITEKYKRNSGWRLD